MTTKGYFVGVDNGTQSTKTIVINGEDGSIAGRATESYGLIEGLPPGHNEQDPAIWIDALSKTLKEALQEAKINPKEVKAIGISAQQHGFVPLDSDGKVIRPAKLWNDTSTIQECNIITRRLGGMKEVISLMGNAVLPGYTAAKILWLKRHEPENYAKLATVLLPHDYLNYYLTGNKVMEYGDASGTALMDVKTRTWSNEAIEAIDTELKERLPTIQGSDKPVGTIKKEIAEAYRFGEDVLLSGGGGDNMMGAIGTGNTSKGIVTASLGTSGTIYAYSDVPVIDLKGEIAAFCDSTNAWLPLLCTMNVTVATEFVRDLFNLSHNELARAVDQAPVGSDGLMLLPYFEGERTPNVPDGTGVFYGLNDRTFNRAHMTRAAMEGVTLGMNYGLNRMRELGIKPMEIRLTGGGSKNRTWRQIAADIFDTDVVCLEIDEGAAYGSALQAMWTYLNHIGERASIQAITDSYVKVDENTRALPRASNAKVYRELQEIQNELSKSLRRSFRRHREYLSKYVAGL
ncbi:MAG: xylulokinase [Candidatus Bathyarchaeota archaeon]|nr:xylulokinase [Candidatus Bathyarchaeota archaeon]